MAAAVNARVTCSFQWHGSNKVLGMEVTKINLIFSRLKCSISVEIFIPSPERKHYLFSLKPSFGEAQICQFIQLTHGRLRTLKALAILRKQNSEDQPVLPVRVHIPPSLDLSIAHTFFVCLRNGDLTLDVEEDRPPPSRLQIKEATQCFIAHLSALVADYLVPHPCTMSTTFFREIDVTQREFMISPRMLSGSMLYWQNLQNHVVSRLAIDSDEGELTDVHLPKDDFLLNVIAKSRNRFGCHSLNSTFYTYDAITQQQCEPKVEGINGDTLFTFSRDGKELLVRQNCTLPDGGQIYEIHIERVKHALVKIWISSLRDKGYVTCEEGEGSLKTSSPFDKKYVSGETQFSYPYVYIAEDHHCLRFDVRSAHLCSFLDVPKKPQERERARIQSLSLFDHYLVIGIFEPSEKMNYIQFYDTTLNVLLPLHHKVAGEGHVVNVGMTDQALLVQLQREDQSYSVYRYQFA